MKLFHTLSFALAFTASSLAICRADTQSAAPLRGLKTFSIVIEGLNENAKKCGVTTDDLQTDISFVLGQSRIVIRGPGQMNDGFIYLNVLIAPDCLATLNLDVETMATIQKNGVVQDVSVWHTGGYSGTSKLPGQIDQFTKMLVVDWNSVNK